MPAGVVDVVISEQEIYREVRSERARQGRGVEGVDGLRRACALRHGQTVVKILTTDISVYNHICVKIVAVRSTFVRIVTTLTQDLGT